MARTVSCPCFRDAFVACAALPCVIPSVRSVTPRASVMMRASGEFASLSSPSTGAATAVTCASRSCAARTRRIASPMSAAAALRFGMAQGVRMLCAEYIIVRTYVDDRVLSCLSAWSWILAIHMMFLEGGPGSIKRWTKLMLH